MPASAVAAGAQSYSWMVGIGIGVLVMLLRNLRPRKLKIERLWLFPLLYLVILGALLYAAPPAWTPLNIGLCVAAALVGAGIGWQRGRLMRIVIDPETHELTSQASIIGLVLILAVMAIRAGLRSYVAQNPGALPISGIVATDALVVLAVAMLTVQRMEVWLRARKLLADAVEAKAAGQTAIVESVGGQG